MKPVCWVCHKEHDDPGAGCCSDECYSRYVKMTPDKQRINRQIAAALEQDDHYTEDGR